MRPKPSKNKYFSFIASRWVLPSNFIMRVGKCAGMGNKKEKSLFRISFFKLLKMIYVQDKIRNIMRSIGLVKAKNTAVSRGGYNTQAPKNGDYDLAACTSAYFEYVYAPNDNSEEQQLDGRYERARKAKAEADKLEFNLSIQKGEYIKTEFLEQTLTSVIMNCRSKLLSIPNKAALELVDKDKPLEIQEILKRYIYEILDELMVPDFDNRGEK